MPTPKPKKDQARINKIANAANNKAYKATGPKPLSNKPRGYTNAQVAAKAIANKDRTNKIAKSAIEKKASSARGVGAVKQVTGKPRGYTNADLAAKVTKSNVDRTKAVATRAVANKAKAAGKTAPTTAPKNYKAVAAKAISKAVADKKRGFTANQVRSANAAKRQKNLQGNANSRKK
jgi:hypothetical protein